MSSTGSPFCVRTQCQAFSVIGRVLVLIALAGIVGVVHSLARPIQLELKPNSPQRAPLGLSPDQSPDLGMGDPQTQQSAQHQAQPQTSLSGPASPSDAGLPSSTLETHISLAQARSLYNSGEADFIDAREPFEYEPSHIPGAYNLTQADFAGGKTPIALEVLDPARPVVIYCGGGTCHASENVAILLQQAGFTSIHIMTVGFPLWVEAGYETDTGPDPLKDGTP